MRIGRTVPPAAAPLSAVDLWHSLKGIFSPERSLKTLEEQIRNHFGVRHVFLVSSGTAGLTLTLMALKSLASTSHGVARTDVVMPAYTCFSVPAAVLKAGLKPVLCDINPATLDFDHTLLDRTLTDTALCVLSHDLFGIPSDIERVRARCGSRGIFVVEDAAQAMGVQSNGRKAGTRGDVGIFSLGRGKNITCGSGGIIVTNSDQIAEAVGRGWLTLASPTAGDVVRELARLVLMMIFIRPRLYWVPAALPFLRLGQTTFPKDIPMKRLSGMHAGLLRNWRRTIGRANRSRSKTAAYFGRRLSLAPARGRALPYLRLPIFAATPKERARIHALSERRGLGLSVAYPTPVNEIPEIGQMYNGLCFPSARSVADHILTVPTHHWLSEHDKSAIAECLETAALSRPSAAGRQRAS